METKAALLESAPSEWRVCTVELDEPRDHEVLVRMGAAGLCHSDAHFAVGDISLGHFPMCGGHEGAGVVEAVGAGVRGLRVGNHVAASFIASCGRCRWCASGRQNLCDNGALMREGHQLDGSYRMHLGGRDVGQFGLISTFSEWTVMPDYSCVRIDEDVPFDVAALVACGVPTGWGSAVNGAKVAPGNVVVVMGVGGIGINAVQGAAHAGASRVIAVDPLPMKLEFARELGATDTSPCINEAAELARSLTNGQGADSTIVCVGRLESADVVAAVDSIRKGGVVVLTAAAREGATAVSLDILSFQMHEKSIVGLLYGGMSPTRDIPRLLDLWKAGDLELSKLISARYVLEDINQGYADLLAGRNLRGVVVFD